jgi:hypothetical protein
MAVVRQKKPPIQLTALAGLAAAAITPEQLSAANDELEAANIQGTALITETAFDDLTARAGRTETAEAAVATAQKEANDAKAAEKTATEALAAATKRADDAEAEMARLAEQPGATVTKPRKPAGTSEVEESSANDHQKTVEALHNKMLGIS